MNFVSVRSTRSFLMAAILVSSALLSDQSHAITEESVVRFCVGAFGAWGTRDDEHTPVFEGDSQARSGSESYWRHSYRGVSVPIPMDTEDWWFWFDEYESESDLVGISNSRLDITYSFVPSQISGAIEGANKLATSLGLPGSNLEPLELVRLALTIDPEEVRCDPIEVQSTVNQLSALFVKRLLFFIEDRVYLHEEGVLAHSVFEMGESWKYLFQDVSGRLTEIEIRHERPGQYQGIGFEIDEKLLMESMLSPPWMPLFFEAASAPTADKLLRLRSVIENFVLPDETYIMLDERISKYER